MIFLLSLFILILSLHQVINPYYYKDKLKKYSDELKKIEKGEEVKEAKVLLEKSILFLIFIIFFLLVNYTFLASSLAFAISQHYTLLFFVVVILIVITVYRVVSNLNQDKEQREIKTLKRKWLLQIHGALMVLASLLIIFQNFFLPKL